MPSRVAGASRRRLISCDPRTRPSGSQSYPSRGAACSSDHRRQTAPTCYLAATGGSCRGERRSGCCGQACARSAFLRGRGGRRAARSVFGSRCRRTRLRSVRHRACRDVVYVGPGAATQGGRSIRITGRRCQRFPNAVETMDAVWQTPGSGPQSFQTARLTGFLPRTSTLHRRRAPPASGRNLARLPPLR